MRKQSVIAVHAALTLLPLFCMGVVGSRWLGHVEGTRALERARSERDELGQRVKMLHHALDEAAANPPAATVSLPERQNLAEVLEAIEHAAQESAVESFRTSTQRSATPGRQTLEIQGETGKAQQLAAFLARLEAGPRLLVIHQVEVRASPHGGMAFNLQVAAYHRAKGEK